MWVVLWVNSVEDVVKYLNVTIACLDILLINHVKFAGHKKFQWCPSRITALMAMSG